MITSRKRETQQFKTTRTQIKAYEVVAEELPKKISSLIKLLIRVMKRKQTARLATVVEHLFNLFRN